MSHFFLPRHLPNILLKSYPTLIEIQKTTDLILFDNHVDIGVFPRKFYPDLNQYSRAVHYRIHESDLTIEQLWSFGEEFDPPLCFNDY